ncbi:CdaR family transcriptional regulator [Lentibacillus sp. CBA3610]|uniref:PucR family transcriptional regulator n=1 Tax=Lentibacillus sp. CBA3610 TaxID=2518176 RepID=UPI00159519DB|nr:helix-turn-helix domain-containing protein [Lentibacillus sp. CBA3610]QKY71136.1 PucR family transcriptional regulator [Lentibacillus sp. CBA3610]
MNNILNHPGQFKQHLNDIIDSPENLADYIAEVFECPITIEDSHHHVVSYSKHSENIDEARISTIMNRKVPDKVLNGLWKKGVMPKLIDNDDPVIIPEIDEIGLSNRVAVSIRKKNEILGFIWAHTADKQLNEKELQSLKEAALQVKKLLLKRHQAKETSEQGHNDFFWQLLTGDLTEDGHILRKAEQYNINLDGKLAVAIIQFPNQVTERMKIHAYYLVETQVRVQVLFRLFDDNDFIMITRVNKGEHATKAVQDFIRQFIDKINAQFQINGIRGTSGFVYESPSHIKDSYKQALKVTEVKHKFPNKLDHLIAYEDLGVYEFADDLATIRNQIGYTNPYVERLRAYDAQNHTSLLPTLYVYLQTDSNTTEAARKLFIHSNTMNYRLKRIREIAEFDLNDPSQKTAVYLDLVINELT